MSIHLGFDMGIRNLAFCLLEHKEDKKWKIIAWNNIDLLEGGTSSQDAKRCVACASPAKWIGKVDGKKWCNACATRTRVKKAAKEKPELPTIPCKLSVVELRKLSGLKGSKADMIAWAEARYLVPWKPVKAMDSSLGTILAALDKWLDSVLPAFAAATLIRLENQPVMKGPTMKSVQMILYTLLSHRLRKEHGLSGRIEFVHAGVKTRGPRADSVKGIDTVPVSVAGAEAAKDDGKAYRARKASAEAETVRHLTESGFSEWLTYFNSRSKKSDLADAFLMALRAP
jgi:hypothetical protein